MLSTVAVVAPAGAVTPLAEADVEAFTSRAEAWTEARDEFRESAHVQALDLAEDARDAEEERVAAEEARVADAERRAELAQATTTRPPVTTAPTTVPPTTVPPTTAPPTTTAPAEAAPTTTVAASGTPTANQWATLRQCEASGNYGAVSANGRYRGAYQFSQATWDWVAGLDHPSLSGIDPAAASSADQDAMARSLWQRRGWSPWPICGSQAAAS